MPLLDHFHPPLSLRRPWQGVHAAWANTMAQQLNQGTLPQRYVAMPNVQLGGRIEIDVATMEEERSGSSDGAGVATATWAPPQPVLATSVDFTHLDLFEVQVFHEAGGLQLLAAIELVSPANKDRPSHRRGFAAKCAALLQQGISVIVVDVVTDRLANLHADLVQVLELGGETSWESPTNLYTVAYRTIGAGEEARLEAWPEAIRLGAPLPTVPLWLGSDQVLPLDLEQSYTATCDALRIRP